MFFFISFVGEKDTQVTEDKSSKFHVNDNCSSKIHETEGYTTYSDTCRSRVERCDSFTSADEPITEPKSGSSTLTSSSDWSTLTCVPNDSKSKDQIRSVSNTDSSWNGANVEGSQTNGAVIADPKIVGSHTGMEGTEGTSDLLKPPAPFIECPISSPMIVDTMRIASPVPMIQANAPSNQKKGCSFSTFGYGPDGKLEPVPHTGPENAQDITQTEIDSQSTSSSETPSTHRVRLTTFQKNKVNVAQNGAVPDICNDTMNCGPHKNRRRRIGSNGSSSLTSFSETDDSGSHTSVERDANQNKHLRTPDLLSPFHSRMGSNTSSGVSSVSQDSVSSVARIQAHQGGLVSKLVSSFQNSSLDSTTSPVMSPKPHIGHISKVRHRNWHSAGSNASSGLTGSISDSFSASDAENVDACQSNITDRSKQPSPLNRMDRGGSSGSYNSQESDLSSLQNSRVREYNSSVGEREYSSRESTSQESDISSLDFTPVGSTHKTKHHQRELKAEKKNVSFEKSGKNSLALVLTPVLDSVAQFPIH